MFSPFLESDLSFAASSWYSLCLSHNCLGDEVKQYIKVNWCVYACVRARKSECLKCMCRCVFISFWFSILRTKIMYLSRRIHWVDFPTHHILSQSLEVQDFLQTRPPLMSCLPWKCSDVTWVSPAVFDLYKVHAMAPGTDPHFLLLSD